MTCASATFTALGTTAVVLVADAPALDDARAAVDRVIAEFDVACSRFRDDSELVRLCQGGGARTVSDVLLDAVTAAIRAARLTDGDVDPTLGAAMRALGYDRDFEEVIAREPVAGAPRPRVKIVETPAWQAIRVDPDRRTIETPAGIELDLGATAKALCADRAAAAAHDATGAGVLVSLGGDIALAGPPPEDGWRVRVTDDHRAGVTAPGQWITLCTGGLATSSTQVRRWRTGHGEAHHLLNPATEQPAESPWRTVSVCAASCLDANIASTAAIVRGAGAPQWLESLRLPSRLVSREATVAHLAGWPPDGDDLPEAENQAPAAGAPR